MRCNATNIMMMSSNGNIFRVTGPLCGEFTGHRWIPLTKASDVELWCFLWSVPWINNREAGDLRRHCANYDVIVMVSIHLQIRLWTYNRYSIAHPCGGEREREIQFIGLFEDRGHQGPYTPYKPFNHNLYIGIIIFPHIDNPQSTGYN